MRKTDSTLIYYMSEYARAGLRELSRKMRKSPQRLKYSQRVLERDGVLGPAYCVFDYSYFGQVLFRVYFKGGYIGEKDKERILRELSANAYVTAVYELTGEFDLVVEFACPNPSRFNKELKRTVTLKPSLNNYKIALNVVTYLFPRLYLHRPQEEALEWIIGGDREPDQFSGAELGVARTLLLTPGARLTEIARQCSLNPRTAKRIITDLEKRNIIRGYRRALNTDRLGISRSRLLLKLHNLTTAREREFTDFLVQTREIVQAHKTIGDWDIEVDIEARDKSRTRYIIMQMRKDYMDLVESFRLIEFFDVYRTSYLPMHIFGTQH